MEQLEIPSQGIEFLNFDEAIALFDASMDELRNTVLQIPPFKDPTEWIFENIKISRGKSSRPGELELTGYQRFAASLFVNPEVTQITILKGAQVGYSVFISAMIAYAVGYLGIPVALLQPTEDDAISYKADRLDPLLRGEDAPLASLVLSDTQREVHFTNGAVLRILGAFSDDSFRRYIAKWRLGDEYSAKGWAKSKGSQGEKAELFRARGRDFADGVMMLGSTPLGRDDCRTYAMFMQSNRAMPFVCCPHCGLSQNLKWGEKETPYGFKWTRDEHGYVTECWYQCEGSEGCRIDETHKSEMVDGVDFIPQGGMPKVKGHWGVHWPQWLSEAPQSTWRNLAQEYVNSKGDPEARKVWLNNAAGTVWDDYTASALDANTFAKSIVAYPAEVPDDVVVLTAGIDTQTNKEGSDLEEIASREATVVGWNRHGQMRVIGHWVIPGAPGDATADKTLTDLLGRKFTTRRGQEFSISAAAIDLGGHFADEVRAYTRKFPPRRSIWAVKGKNNAKGTRSPTVWPKKVSKSHKSGARFYTIDSQLAKDAIFRLLQLRGDSAPMIPCSMPADYMDKIMCEERRRIGGGWYWQPKKGGRAEEEWACLAYAYAALKGLQASWTNWTDLNVAGDKLGIPQIVFDPETGEVDYDGEDMSVHAVERKTAKVALDQVGVVPATLASRAQSEKTTNQNSKPSAAAVPQGPVVETTRKRRRGSLIR